jgi:hypothetical protein
VQYLEVPHRNHFDVILDWMDSEAPLTRHTWPLFESDGPTTSRQV